MPCGELRNGEGELLRKELPVTERVEARDFRSAWADEGWVPGEDDLAWAATEGGGVERVQSLPARAASSLISRIREIRIRFAGLHTFSRYCVAAQQ